MNKTVKIGNYRNNVLAWNVLEESERKLLVLSDRVLDYVPYNETSEQEPTSWALCSLRKWLNNDFFNVAFNDAEKTKIVSTLVSNYKNRHLRVLWDDDMPDYDELSLDLTPEYIEEYRVEERTDDKLFIPSLYECYEFRSKGISLMCKTTRVVEKLIKENNEMYIKYFGCEALKFLRSYWLRDSGYSLDTTSIATISGEIQSIGVSNIVKRGIRPMMWILK